MNWQHIETAPKSDSFKDAITILVFRGDLGFETQIIEIESSINWKWYKDNGCHYQNLQKKKFNRIPQGLDHLIVLLT